MKKMGECNHCGWCCQFEGVHRNVAVGLDTDTKKFYELRGGKLQPNGAKLHYIMHAYLPCSQHNIAEKKCNDYENRPSICKNFPEKPSQIEGTPCSHWFEYEENGVTIRRGGYGSPYPTPPRFGD